MGIFDAQGANRAHQERILFFQGEVLSYINQLLSRL